MLLELFLEFLKLGLFTIGGGVAMIPILSDAMVNRKKWFTEEEMIDIVAICQSTPGVIAINMATYVGFRKKGFPGSLVATIGVLMPSFFIILAIAVSFTAVSGNRFIQGALGGLRAASAGLILYALWNIIRKSIKDIWQALAAIAAAVLIMAFDIPVAWIIVGYLIAGIVIACVKDSRYSGHGGEEK